MCKEIAAFFTALALTVVGSGIAGVITADKPSSSSMTTTYISDKPNVKGAKYALSYNEYNEICSVVMAESGGEPYDGQLAVAQTILNTCRIEKRRPPETIKTHGYTSWRPEPSESVQNAVTEVFADGREVLDKHVTMFYAPALMKNGYSKDHEQEIYSATIGGHKFFIERRYADIKL